jgi:hypothetical protein
MMISLLEKVLDFRAYRDGVREDLFGEVRELVLSEAQLERWGRFERHHRRQRIDEIDTGALSGGAVDLIGLVNEMDVDPETRENLDSVLDRYAKELDEVIRRRIEMADEFSERQIEGMKERGPNPMAMMDIYEEMFEETREAVLEAREITEKYERLIAASLGEETRGAFRRAFDRAFVPRVYGRSRAAEAVETALSMESLTEGQRTELETLEEAYRREARPINRRWAEALLEHEAERMTIMEVFGPGGVQDEAVREAARARRDLDDRYIEKVAAALTPEQREQLPERSRGDWRDEEFGG